MKKIVIIADALMIEGEIEKKFFRSVQDEQMYKNYITKYNRFQTEECEKILEESEEIEKTHGEEEANLYFVQNVEKRVTIHRPIIDTSKIKEKLVDMTNPHSRGKGEIKITLPMTL